MPTRQQAIERYQKIDIEYGDLIESLVNDGWARAFILKRTNLTHRVLYRFLIWKNHELLDKLHYNKRGLNFFWKTEEAIERYKKTDEIYGGKIEEQIRSGRHMAAILRSTGLKLTYFRRYIRWKNKELVDILRENGILINRQHALQNSIKGAEKTKGTELKPLTDEARTLYTSMLEGGSCLAEIQREMAKLGFKNKKVDQLRQRLGDPPRRSFVGVLNPAYGKQPSHRCGKGIHGWFVSNSGNKILFRSSFELKVFKYLSDNGIFFTLADTRIPYLSDDIERTYCPDIIVGNFMYEIKPKKLVSTALNKAKFAAAELYCKQHGYSFGVITEDSFLLEDFTLEVFNGLLASKTILLSSKQKKRMEHAISKGWIL